MKILVDPVSATCRLIHTCPELTIAIDRNHSDLIKLNRDDPDLDIIISKLREILRPRSPEQTPISVLDSALSFSTLSLSAPGALRPWFNEPEGADSTYPSMLGYLSHEGANLVTLSLQWFDSLLTPRSSA